jgi:phosphatidylserine/phosphatidylglycerophosphate/cardiolipin synthase-like enzyme
VLHIAITLALGALWSALPAASVTPGVTIATCFAPEEDCAAFAVDAIDAGEREILVRAYSLTTCSGILEELVRAAQRGIDVRLIADRTTPCESKSGIDPLARAGASVWIDRGVRIAHAKSMVIEARSR